MNNNVFIEYLKIVIPTGISLIAAIFSILTYRRNRKLENENYIFKTKQENYSKILLELGYAIDILQQYMAEFDEFLEDKNDFTSDEIMDAEDQINELAIKVEDLIFNFENVVIANSLVAPKPVLEKLDNICDMLISIDIPYSTEKDPKAISRKVDSEINRIIELANEINEFMRSDLSVEELNFSLYKRLKK